MFTDCSLRFKSWACNQRYLQLWRGAASASCGRSPRLAGWLRAMLLSGTVDTPECRDRCTRLAQAMKAVVKGRDSHYDGLTTENEIAAVANLPIGWVFNAIKSRLLGVVFPKDRWDATIDK